MLLIPLLLLLHLDEHHVLLGESVHVLGVLGVNLIDAGFDGIAEDLPGQVLDLLQTLLVGRLVLQHVPKQDEGCLLHDKERPTDCVHLARVRIALPLHTEDMVDAQ